MNSKKFLAFTMAAAMTLSLAACSGNGGGAGSSGGSSASGSTGDTSTGGVTAGTTVKEVVDPTGAAFKIGATGPLTGDASIYGLAAYRGAQIAVNEINSEGGDIQFELNYQDDQNVPETAVNAFNNLKDWGMQISLGSVTTQPGIATSQYNFEDRIFALTPSASSPDVIANKDNVFQMCFSDPNQGLASAQYIYEQNLGENVYIIWKNDDVYSTGIKDQFVAEAEELGLNIVGDSTFTTDTSNDFTVQLTDAQQKGADLIFLPMYYQPASLILTQADSMGYEPKFFGVDGMDGILTMEGFDASLAEGVMLLTPFNADATDDATVSLRHRVSGASTARPPTSLPPTPMTASTPYKLALETAGCTPDMTAEAHQRRPDCGVPHHHPDRPDRRRRGHHLGLHRRGVQGPQGHGHRERRLRGHGLRSPLPASDKPLPFPGGPPSLGRPRPGRGAVNERGDASERSRRAPAVFRCAPEKRGINMDITIILNYLIRGISLGSVYAIIALGYTMVYGIAKMLNFAHGDVIMVGAYVCFFAMSGLSANFAEGSVAATVVPAVAGTLLAMVVCTVLGVVIERLAYKPLRQAAVSGGAHHRHRRELLFTECGAAAVVLQPQGVHPWSPAGAACRWGRCPSAM